MSTGGQNLADFSMNDLFKMEVETQAAILNDGLLALERDPNQPERFEALMRAAHSIKGAARIVSLDCAVQLAHVIEDCFVAAQEKRLTFVPSDVDVLLAGVDLLIEISKSAVEKPEAWLSANGQKYGDLIGKLKAILTGEPKTQEPTAPVAATANNAETSPAAKSETSPKTAVQPKDAELSPAEHGSPTADAASAANRVVRVTTERLNRLMGLAGELLVESKRLIPFGVSLLKVKTEYNALLALMEQVERSLPSTTGTDETRRLLAEARERSISCRQHLIERINDLESFARRADDLSSRLYREVVASQMRPFSDGIQSFPRMVRDLSRSLDKQVRLEVSGEKTEVDRDILERLEAPLNHILRNAIDHGLESPQERSQTGKPPEGTLRMEARHSAGTLVITISDDGRGVNLERLKKKILERGMVGADVVDRLSDAELIDFLFLPGFSTAEKVTEVSGRGVGLDVVASMVHGVGGVVRATNNPGKGLTIGLQLPITLSVAPAVLVEIAGEPYAFPLTRVDRILIVSPGELSQLEGKPCLNLDRETLGLVPAAQVLELDENSQPTGKLSVVVVSDRTHRYGVVVDKFLGEGDLVVRPLDPRLGKLQDISAASVLEDGTPLLIVDVEDLVRSIANILTGGRLHKLTSSQSVAKAEAKRILVVDDSITVREMERRLLENLGYQVDVAVDGMDGWNSLRAGQYDLVISDIDMPRLNGFELVRMIKRDSRLSRIPVIIVSYKDREEDRLRGLEAGANCYLTKSSFQDQTLISRVVDLIGEAK